MKYVYPEIGKVFETGSDFVNTLVIENQGLFCRIIEDFQNQINGFEGKGVLSTDDKIMPMNKNLEVFSQFVPFEINRKNLISKICSAIEAKAINEEFCFKTSELMTEIESFLMERSFDFDCNLSFERLNFASLVKASGLEIADDYDSLGEKIIDLMELITEFDREKFYVIINLRSYLSDEETERFMDTVIRHRFSVLMIESNEHLLLPRESRFLVDKDLCEIS